MSDDRPPGQEPTAETITSFEEARLQVWDIVNLQSVANESERYSVHYIGMAKKRSVLVSMPTIDGRYVLTKDGQGFVLRGFSGKNAFAFATQVLKSVNTPYPYLHLSYPREVRSLVVRKGTRANVQIICAITDANRTSRSASGMIVNISIGGALLNLKEEFGEVGNPVVVKFKVRVNGIEAVLELKSVIRAINIDQSADVDMRYRIGVQFLDIAPDDSIPLLAFVYHELLEQMPGA